MFQDLCKLQGGVFPFDNTTNATNRKFCQQLDLASTCKTKYNLICDTLKSTTNNCYYVLFNLLPVKQDNIKHVHQVRTTCTIYIKLDILKTK